MTAIPNLDPATRPTTLQMVILLLKAVALLALAASLSVLGLISRTISRAELRLMSRAQRISSGM